MLSDMALHSFSLLELLLILLAIKTEESENV